MRKADLCLILTSSLLLLSLGLSFFVLPKKSFSEEENRALTLWTPPTVSELFDGTATARLSSFYTDQFPLRSFFTTAKAQTERLLGKQENNGVFFGKEGYLIPRADYTDLSVAEDNLSAISALLQGSSVPLSLLIAPRSVDVMSHCLPTFYSPDPSIFNLLADSDLPYTLPLDTLRSAAAEGEEVWYKTDHHWTTRGAYLAYAELAQALQITPFPLSYFQQETVSESFLGTSHAKIGGMDASPDSVILFRYAGDDRYAVTNGETGQTTHGLYAPDALEQRDHYRIFLGGNTARLSISLPDAVGRPRLLLIKDSFANSLVPFLALHFDLEVIDPRYHKEGLSKLTATESFDRILLVQGLDTLATDGSLGRWTK